MFTFIILWLGTTDSQCCPASKREYHSGHHQPRKRLKFWIWSISPEYALLLHHPKVKKYCRTILSWGPSIYTSYTFRDMDYICFSPLYVYHLLCKTNFCLFLYWLESIFLPYPFIPSIFIFYVIFWFQLVSLVQKNVKNFAQKIHS